MCELKKKTGNQSAFSIKDKKGVRFLMWAHYIYLLLLPTLAVVSSEMLFPKSDFHRTLLLVCFPCVLMYTLFLANGYALPNSLPIALLVTTAIPLQIAVSVFIFGRANFWIFFAENAAVEICPFVLGTLSAALAGRSKEFSAKSFALLLVFTLAVFSGGLIAYVLLVYYCYGGFSPWLILFVTSFATAGWKYANVYKKVVARYRKTGAAQEVIMEFDGGFPAKLLGIKTDVPLVTPLRDASGKNGINKPILLFGFTAMFLPLVVGMTLEIILR